MIWLPTETYHIIEVTIQDNLHNNKLHYQLLEWLVLNDLIHSDFSYTNSGLVRILDNLISRQYLRIDTIFPESQLI